MLVFLFSQCTHRTDVSYENIEIMKHANELVNDTTIRYIVEIDYLNPVAGPENLQTAIGQITEKWLKGLFPNQSTSSQNISDVADADMNAFIKRAQRETSPDQLSARAFELYVSPDSIQYQNAKLLSLSYRFYTYQQGAHGMNGVYCINFDKKTGEEITCDRLISKEADLLAVAETHFRKQQNLAKDESFDGKYFFENNKFVLSKSFAFTANGIYFFYQPYEIAPYASGVIELFLPRKDIQKYIRY
jgi:hypothetical protein